MHIEVKANEQEKSFISGFAGSLLVHLALLILYLVVPAPKAPEAPLIFDVIDKPVAKNSAHQVIRQPDLPDLSSQATPEDKLRFLAERTQRVKEELRALRSGLTKNRSPEPVPQQMEKPRSQLETPPQKELDTTGFEKFLPNKIQIPTPRQAQRNQDRGFSTLSEDLPQDIHIGEITAVDTDHYLFYSYFARAQELLWNEWAPMVESIVFRPPPSLKASNQMRFTTLLEAWFLPSGQLHSVHLLKPSGVPELDYAASSAFKRVGMIPNPPREKIDPDGLIRFKWGLTVEYDPKVLVRQ